MPVAQSSSSEKSVGAGSPRSVSVSSRLRRVAASMRRYSPARSARDRGDVRERLALRLAARIRAARRRRRSAGCRSSQPKPASDAAPSCFSSCFRPMSKSNCQARQPGDEVAVEQSATPSATRISAGPMRRSSLASACGAISATRSSPLASDSQARPTAALVPRRASRTLSALSSSSAESVSVPGVTMRVTCRSTGPLAVAGSPICSQIATDSPSLHELGEVLLDRVTRHARHLDRRAGRGAARGEGDVEQPRGALGVVVEQLVEVAHPVEEQDVRMLAP